MQPFRFERVLFNTDPHMRDNDPNPDPEDADGTFGGDVSDAQKLLADNRFGKGNPTEGRGSFYHPKEPQNNDPQGVFGPNTAEACYSARFWMGYPKRGKNAYRRRRFTATMARRLRGDHKLSPLMQVRRRRRLRAAQASIGKKALERAKAHIGEKENPPGSNKTATTAWWGYNAAWCLMFVSRCYIEAGSKVFKRGSRYSYNPTLRAVVKAGHPDMHFVPFAQAEPGDIVQFDLNDGTEPPDHGSLFVRWDGSIAVTLDGNVGDDVGYERWNKSQIMDIIRVTA